MRAWRLHHPGGPEAFVLEDLPRPTASPGEVLIRVRAFGLNRSEWFTRVGESPTVVLPRVLGIECVGEVKSAPGGEFEPGQRVVAFLGGMGREFDGSYAEYTCVPTSSVFAVRSALDWHQLGALPEMLQTCHGSLHIGLCVVSGETILIRGGTSSIGLMALAMAKVEGLRAITTTRDATKRKLLLQAGADEVVIDDGAIAQHIMENHPGGVDRVLELVGTTTLLDSLGCARAGGVVCLTGILGGEWKLQEFRPMSHIPTGVRLTSYSGGPSDISRKDLQHYIDLVETGVLAVKCGPVWPFERLIDAHRAMDENRANGKMVVTLP